MSHNPLALKEGALFIADAHYSHQKPQLLELLKAIATGEVAATQLILMGDIFDQIFGGIPYTVSRNSEAVETIQRISKMMEVVYLEGNHDFRLASIFDNIQTFPIAQQPVRCSYQGASVLLAHGDFNGPLGYRFYTALIRNRWVLALLRRIDEWSGHSIVHWVDRHNGMKEDCNQFSGFDAFVKQHLSRTDLTDIDYFIEGHYHQNCTFPVGPTRYINLAAFACNQRYFELKSLHNQPLLQEVVFGKE